MFTAPTLTGNQANVQAAHITPAAKAKSESINLTAGVLFY